MTGSARFIVISVLPREAACRVDEARRRICSVGRSKAALSYPPHITLRTGALVPPEEVSSFIEDFGRVVGTWEPFLVRTDGLLLTSYRDGEALKYLIGYRVVKDVALAGLNERLLRYERWRATDRLAFEPHLTLAFDDLGLTGYEEARSWLEENPQAIPESLEWTCDNVGVFRQEGGQWRLFSEWRQPSPDRPGPTN